MLFRWLHGIRPWQWHWLQSLLSQEAGLPSEPSESCAQASGHVKSDPVDVAKMGGDLRQRHVTVCRPQQSALSVTLERRGGIWLRAAWGNAGGTPVALMTKVQAKRLRARTQWFTCADDPDLLRRRWDS